MLKESFVTQKQYICNYYFQLGLVLNLQAIDLLEFIQLGDLQRLKIKPTMSLNSVPLNCGLPFQGDM